MPFLISIIIGREKLRILFITILLQSTLNKKILKYRLSTLTHQSILSPLTKSIKRKLLLVKFISKKLKKLILKKLTLGKISNPYSKTKNLLIKKVLMVSIFYGLLNHSVKDVEEPEEPMIYH